jgi:DNA uptake protein ComE-like DNA-binding protein
LSKENPTVKLIRCTTMTALSAMFLFFAASSPLHAQLGKGLFDANTASPSELQALPNMTPAIVKNMVDKRPFLTILDLNAFLLGQKLTQAQATEFYRKAFVQINLNTGSPEEFMMVPGSGKRMSAEFAEYRPWKNWLQFDKEIGKYVGQQETDRFKQYMFIPINLNTASDELLLTIPGVTPAMVQGMKKARPWKAKDEDFEFILGKIVGAKDARRIGRYLATP